MDTTPELEPTTTYDLTAEQLEATREKIAKLNQRAAAKGLGGAVELSWEHVAVTDTDDFTGMKRTRMVYRTTVTGKPLAYQGWEFLATLDWDEYAGLVVRALPGAVAIEREGLREGWCDHCKATRARRVTYVVREQATGRQIQVGRSCVKDFLGWAPTPAFLDAHTPADGWFGESGHSDFTPLTVLAYAWAVIKLEGFVPTSQHWSTSTRDLVSQALYPNRRSAQDRAFAEKMRPLADEATERAGEILAFLLSDDFSGGSDYVLNLKSVAAGAMVNPKYLGLLVSAPQAYAKHQERTLIRERQQAEVAESQWVGTPADKAAGVKATRLTVTVTVRTLRYINGDYGTSTLYTLLADDGNLYKWFASSDVLGDREGARFKIIGSVKKHEEFNGVKSTVLTRCKVIETLGTADGEQEQHTPAEEPQAAQEGPAALPVAEEVQEAPSAPQDPQEGPQEAPHAQGHAVGDVIEVNTTAGELVGVIRLTGEGWQGHWVRDWDAFLRSNGQDGADLSDWTGSVANMTAWVRDVHNLRSL